MSMLISSRGMPQISVTFFQNFISLKNRMMLLLAAIDVGARYQRYLHYTMPKSRMVQYCHIFPPFCQKLKKASGGPYTLAASRCRTPFASVMGRSGFGRLCREKNSRVAESPNMGGVFSAF